MCLCYGVVAGTRVGSIVPSVLSEHSSRAGISGEAEVQGTEVTVQSLPPSAALSTVFCTCWQPSC